MTPFLRTADIRVPLEAFPRPPSFPVFFFFFFFFVKTQFPPLYNIMGRLHYLVPVKTQFLNLIATYHTLICQTNTVPYAKNANTDSQRKSIA